MFTWGSRYRSAALAVTLAAALGVMSAPPAGATASVSYVAIASWVTHGSTASDISLQVTATQGTDPQLFFVVNQQFCDTARDQEVFRAFSGSQPASPALFAVGPHLSSAVLGLRHVPMSGSEQRVDGCTDAAVHAHSVHTNSLGSFRASLYGSWSATSPGVLVQPGIRGRDGTAFGVELSGGPLNLGDLGASGFAQLRKVTTPNH